MLGQVKTAAEMGGNLGTFDRFFALAGPYLKPDERHLTVCKNGMTTFAQAISMEFRGAQIDYTEFSPGQKASLQDARRIGSDAPPRRIGEGGEYDSVSLFLTLHDYRDFEDRLKMVGSILPSGGKLFVIEYNFKPWISRTADPAGEFKTWFSVRNEKAALANEANCFEHHTWLGLDDIVRGALSAGFETRHAEAHPYPVPKFCLYVGVKT